MLVGTQPVAVAVNPVTNKIYTANRAGGSVTVVDGATHARVRVAVGNTPTAIAANPTTNKIYVANSGSAIVTVIDGATNATATVAVRPRSRGRGRQPGDQQDLRRQPARRHRDGDRRRHKRHYHRAAGATPAAVAVNPVTNKVYVANEGSDDVTVIDGATDGTTTVPIGPHPVAVAVNPATNKVYVAVATGVTVIDGTTHVTTTLTAGTGPAALAVNAVTNKVYVANHDSDSVTVIDGTTLSARHAYCRRRSICRRRRYRHEPGLCGQLGEQ